jgi:ATP-binding cassette subfamily F protein uup
MPLVTLQDIYLSYGQPPLIDHINLVIERGERVCLIGRNGAGKSTLLKILTGQIIADDGILKRASGVKIAQLEQSVPQNTKGSVFDVIAQGLGAEGELAQRYHHLIAELGNNPSDQTMRELEDCQAELDRVDGWDINTRVEAIITKMDLDADMDISSLSGGYKRRVLLARALVCDPDLLLLDEPTNHLDIDAIQWVEQFLLKWEGSLLFISHDRRFMENLATRFIEIDRGQLTEFNCNYATYLTRKEDMQDVEDKQNALFDKRLSQEEIWIRQGIKARRTRNEGRVRALEAMRREYADRRKRQGTARMDIQQAEKSGKIVAEAENINFAFDGSASGEKVISNFSTLIQRGDKVGFIGRNGVGKTTLIKLLLGELSPQTGTIKTGTNLSVAYFDQYRSALDEEKTVQDNVSGGRDMLEIGGKPRHVISYLQDFLFAPERCRQPVKALSGGERNRLLLAKLFTQPSNILVLDEPTNDLDIDTLDLLEELLIDYKGTIILVSHDRTFLNNVVTSTLVFEGHGQINQFIGGYDDWLRQRKAEQAIPSVASAPKVTAKTKKAAVKLSYKDQRELDSLPQQIEQLETEISQVSERISQPDFYKAERTETEQTENHLTELQKQLSQCYDRWELLEAE